MIDAQNYSDEEIIEKVKTNNHDFYAIIISRYQKKLLRYANTIINDTNKATDIVQESFIKAYVNLNSFNSKMKFSSWLYRIVHNEAINVTKRFRREVLMPEDFDFSSEEDIEESFVKKEIKNKVDICLKKKPIIYSEPLSLFYLDERSYEEISDILRIPIGTVATRINRGKKILKKICQTK